MSIPCPGYADLMFPKIVPTYMHLLVYISLQDHINEQRTTYAVANDWYWGTEAPVELATGPAATLLLLLACADVPGMRATKAGYRKPLHDICRTECNSMCMTDDGL